MNKKGKGKSMKCFNCGKELPDNAKYCSGCGEEQGFSEELLERAQAGDEGALSELYRRTYAAAYKMAAVLIKNEDAVMDVLQDSYVKAFRNLNQLREPDKFRAWMKRIVHNQAVDYLRKQKPSGVRTVSSDEENTAEIPDDRISSLPEEIIDQKETARLIGGLLDGLSQEQRAVIVMYYYEQLSVRDIAYTLGINENTVKSRLMHGRKNIEAGVKKLEKQGTKLYGLSPIPFLLLLFRNWDTQVSVSPESSILSSVMERAAQSSDLGASAAGDVSGLAEDAVSAAGSAAGAGSAAASGASGAAAAAGMAGKSIAVKILVGVLVAGTVGGTAGALYYHNSQRAAEEQEVAETAGEPEEQPEEETGFTGELLQNVNYDARQEPGETVTDPYIECFPGSDIPKPDLFFDLEPQNQTDTWEQNGEANYAFFDPAAQGRVVRDENGDPVTESSPVDAMLCVNKMNTYLTWRGYGREACYSEAANGGTTYIWYKEESQVRITVLAENSITFTALMGPDHVYVPETLGGPWKGEARDENGNYVVSFHFDDDGRVYYLCGVKDSDVALMSEGTYEVIEDKLHMAFEEDLVSGETLDWDCVYRFKAVNGSLEMEYISGDSINRFQEAGELFYLDRSQSSEIWMGPEEEPSSDEVSELSEEDKRYICEQLHVPPEADVVFQLGEEYYWEGAGVMLIPVSIYENGEYVAGADINRDTKEVMTSIVSYQN